MKLISALVVFALVLITANCVFVVREGETALLLQFGRIEGVDEQGGAGYKPGLYFKFPLMQQVLKFDNRILNLETQPERYFTSEKKSTDVDFYVKWKIDNAAEYYQSFGVDDQQVNAKQRLTPIVKDLLNSEFRSNTLRDLISSARTDITDRVREQATNKAIQSHFGIRVVDVRIKRIELPAEVSHSVFKRMQAERQKAANELRARGQEAAIRIKADADREALVLKAEATKEGQITRGEGDAHAAEIYAAAYGKDVDFYAFYRSLEAYRETFKTGNGVLVLDPKSEFLRYFGESK